MKIAAVSHSLSRLGGGIPPVLQPLYSCLIQDYGITAAVFGLRDALFPEDAASWGDVPCQAFNVKGPAAIGMAPGIGKALRAFRPDILHTHGIWKYTSRNVSAAHRQLRAPYMISPHGMLEPWALQQGRFKKKVAGFWFETKHMRQASCFHALCEQEAKSIRSLGFRQPVFVIPNAVQLPEAGLHSGNAATEPYLLFLGRIHPKKGLAELIQAWHLLGSRRAHWQLKIAGWDDGGHAPALEKMAATYGLTSSVHFLGPVFGNDKNRLLDEASGLVLPSFSEGLPMTILEAWAHSLPVLKTEFCNLPEGFEANAAIHITPDPKSIADGLHRLISMSPADRRELGARGRRLVEERFTWQSVARAYHAVYTWIRGGNRPDTAFD